MENIILKAIRRIRKHKFTKSFCKFESSSAIGKNGTGKGCKISGTQHISIGQECFFGEGTELVALESHFSQQLNPNLSIGNHVRCIGGCRITCAGNITLEDDILIGPDVFITDHNHGMDPDFPDGYSKQPLIVKDVIIEKGVWLGQRACVLPGVTVGSHSIIGANSVVTRDVPPYSMAVGCPARIVKHWDNLEHRWISHAFSKEKKTFM